MGSILFTLYLISNDAINTSFSNLSFFSVMPAFHILNNTTIQFKLEKIPIERESELTFSLSPDDLGTSSIMKIEGKFVNPVQVSTLLIFMSGQLKSYIYFILTSVYSCLVMLRMCIYEMLEGKYVSSKRQCDRVLLLITCSVNVEPYHCTLLSLGNWFC